MKRSLEGGATNLILICLSPSLVFYGGSLSPFFKDFLMTIALVKLCSDSCLLEMKQKTINLQCHYTVK